MGRPRKNPTPEQADAEIAALAQEGMKKKRPRTAVLERRLQNVFGEPSMAVQFKDRSLAARWFNDAARPGQIYRAQQLGWEPATPDMIVDMKAIGAHDINPAGQVTRGERGQELLMYMPQADRIQIQAAKTAENNRRMRSGAVQRTELLEAVGQHNPETADFMDKRVTMNVDTKDFVETRQITPEVVE
jgi:hypothetical protein